MLTELGVVGEAVHLDAEAASQLVQADGIQDIFQWTETGALWETTVKVDTVTSSRQQL